jgi:hypothetical protein
MKLLLDKGRVHPDSERTMKADTEQLIPKRQPDKYFGAGAERGLFYVFEWTRPKMDLPQLRGMLEAAGYYDLLPVLDQCKKPLPSNPLHQVVLAALLLDRITRLVR